MAEKFTELRAGMSQAAREKSDGMARQMVAEMPLNELRQARGLSQKILAEVLHVQQPSIAKLERRTDRPAALRLRPQPTRASNP